MIEFYSFAEIIAKLNITLTELQGLTNRNKLQPLIFISSKRVLVVKNRNGNPRWIGVCNINAIYNPGPAIKEYIIKLNNGPSYQNVAKKPMRKEHIIGEPEVFNWSADLSKFKGIIQEPEEQYPGLDNILGFQFLGEKEDIDADKPAGIEISVNTIVIAMDDYEKLNNEVKSSDFHFGENTSVKDVPKLEIDENSSNLATLNLIRSKSASDKNIDGQQKLNETNETPKEKKQPIYRKPEEIAKKMGISVGTLANWRSQKKDL